MHRPRPRVERQRAYDQLATSGVRRRDPQAAQHLANLKAAIRAAGLPIAAELVRHNAQGHPIPCPFLRVAPADDTGQGEDIRVRSGGTACDLSRYVWGCGQVITPITEPEQAAAIIGRALTMRRNGR